MVSTTEQYILTDKAGMSGIGSGVAHEPVFLLKIALMHENLCHYQNIAQYFRPKFELYIHFFCVTEKSVCFLCSVRTGLKWAKFNDG